MAKVLAYVEGQTEERFIKNVLAPQLAEKGIWLIPTIATTKVVKAGPNFKGGTIPYPKARKEILRLLNDSSAVAVTTMLDYYGLHDSFPGRGAPKESDAHERAHFLQDELTRDINDSRFIPFLTLHEYEALLFSSPDVMAESLPGGTNLRARLRSIRDSVTTPEEIDDHPSSAPHRRIENVFPGYDKRLHGALIAARIGLNKIRKECPHFGCWVGKLEVLAED